MKKLIYLLFTFFSLNLFAQEIELLITTDEVYEVPRRVEYVESWWGPSGFYVNEINDEIVLLNRMARKEYVISENKIKQIRAFEHDFNGSFYMLNRYEIGTIDNLCSLSIKQNNETKSFIRTGTGICFILKKENGYIVYYVDKNGIPGAVDTDGKIYSNKEATDYLKFYDSDKYQISLDRAEKLRLKEKFLNSEVLIWGETYYSTLYITTKYWTGNEDNYLFVKIGDKFQYDLQGNAYQLGFFSDEALLAVVSIDGTWFFEPLKLDGFSKLLSSQMNSAALWYIGFGGNIYYYIAGEDCTEVFRIRRTWGNPDFYAVAINGYTEDEYGKYVNEVLSKMSKADLRLLRNTIFALYGVHFKSEDLSKYFDKQVWYTDEGLTSGDVTLPAHRQKLVEMIQKLEK